MNNFFIYPYFLITINSVDRGHLYVNRFHILISAHEILVEYDWIHNLP